MLGPSELTDPLGLHGDRAPGCTQGKNTNQESGRVPGAFHTTLDSVVHVCEHLLYAGTVRGAAEAAAPAQTGHSSEGPGRWPICIESTAKAYAALLLPPTFLVFVFL